MFHDEYTAFAQGTHRHFGLPRHADLSHHDDVQGTLQDARGFKGDGHAASRETDHHDLLASKLFREAFAQALSGFSSISERLHTSRSTSRIRNNGTMTEVEV